MTEDQLVEARMRTLSALSGATVHELRGAANSLALHLQLLTVEPETDEVRERQRRSLALADQGRRRLFDIAEVFVRHAMVPDPREGAFDLAAVAADAVALARPYAVARCRAELTIAVEQITPPVVGRRDVVAQALLDLLVDILDRSEQGAKLEIALEPNDRHVRVVIRAAAVPDSRAFDRFTVATGWAGGSVRRLDDGSVVLELPADSRTERME
jgi:signal transduction histidine kinase